MSLISWYIIATAMLVVVGFAVWLGYQIGNHQAYDLYQYGYELGLQTGFHGRNKTRRMGRKINARS